MPRLGQFTARSLQNIGVGTRIIHTGTFAIREVVSNTVITTTDAYSWTSDQYVKNNTSASIFYSTGNVDGTKFYGTSTTLGSYNNAQGYTLESWIYIPSSIWTTTLTMNVMGLQKGPVAFSPPAIDSYLTASGGVPPVKTMLTNYVGGAPTYTQSQGGGTTGTNILDNWTYIVQEIGPYDGTGSWEQVWINGYSTGATKIPNPSMTITQSMTILELGSGWQHKGFRGYINEARVSKGLLYNTTTGISSITPPTSKFTTSTSTLVLIQPG
jgi:hypothetical protein